MKRKTLSILLMCMLLLSLVACKGTPTKLKVGISYPSIPLQRSSHWAPPLKAPLEALGYEVVFKHADNDPHIQASQIVDIIAGGCDLLVIAAIESASLGSVLAQAEAKNIPVIAYDCMISGDAKIDYYITFDNLLVGKQQGQFIEENLNLTSADGPFNIEIFTGDAGDTAVLDFHGNAISVLQPYIDSGRVKVLSGQTSLIQTATAGWSTENARSRMEMLIASQGYGPGGIKLDAVLCSNDSTALGVTLALLEAGYTAENFPVITGQDCDKPNVINLLAGLQAMSVFKDARKLEEQAVKMIDAILQGKEPEIHDREAYSNDRGKIPTYLCQSVVVTIDNYKEILLDSGYYDSSEFDL